MKFTFGKNWLSFSKSSLTEKKINTARLAFLDLTKGCELKGNSFLDIGFGQGIALHLAQECGADVVGIDIDQDCGKAIQETNKYFNSSTLPKFEIVSILDADFLSKLSTKEYHVVHSWGVLHHTGDMNLAIKNAVKLVKPGGFFILAIYNRHWSSPIWTYIKKIYCMLPGVLQEFFLKSCLPFMKIRAKSTRDDKDANTERGMDLLHDIRDWLGGYPFEYASISEIEDLIVNYGFERHRVIETMGWTGCNQFVFRKL